MREFTCIICGKVGIDRSVTGNKLYCSKKCRDKYVASLLIPCKFNAGVYCERQKCSSCGWNPDVAKRRKEKLFNG